MKNNLCLILMKNMICTIQEGHKTIDFLLIINNLKIHIKDNQITIPNTHFQNRGKILTRIIKSIVNFN